MGYRNDEITGKKIEERLKYCIEHICTDPLRISERPSKKEKIYNKEGKIIILPIFERMDTSKITLPVLTIILAGLDGLGSAWVGAPRT